MKQLGSWLASRWPELAVLVALEIAVWFALEGAGVSRNLTTLVCASIALAWALALGFAFARSHALMRQAQAVGTATHPLETATDLIPPRSPEGRELVAALEAVAGAAHTRLGEVTTEAREARDYTESWVHEIKTPIAAARLALENNPGPGTAQVASQLDRIGFYVDQALYVARSDSVDRDYLIRDLPVRSLVSAAVRERRRSLFDAGMAVDLSGVPEGATVRGDEKWLVFMLGQLIDNAVKYRKGEGEAPDAADSNIVQPHVAFTFSTEGEGARAVSVLTVEDNGLGVPAADVPRIFDRGFTGTRGRADGSKATGIGLYLVRELATKMALDVRAESVEGEYTRISLLFPTA